MSDHELLDLVKKAQDDGDHERAELAMMLLWRRLGGGPIDGGREYDLFGSGDLCQDEEAREWLLERALGLHGGGDDGRGRADPSLVHGDDQGGHEGQVSRDDRRA